MTSPPEAEAKQLAAALSELQKRFERLGADEMRLTAGARTLSEGVGLLLEELSGDAEAKPARLGLLCGGLEGLADLLEAYAPGLPAAEDSDAQSQPEEDADPMAQFREMFRAEARQRLRALSISMMSIFNEWSAREALTESAAHLHAIRGAASMLGLDKIAKLTTLMEEVVLQMAEAESFERAWPTRALLRGVHLLDAAVADEFLELDISRTVGAMRALHAYSTRNAQELPAELAGEPVSESGGEAAEASRITQPLEQVERESVGLVGAPKKKAPPVYTGEMGKRILIVDDIETIAASVGFILSELEVPIDMAENGAKALEMMRERPYSLVVSDVDMPRMDGVTLTRMVREDPEMRAIPVILLTSLDRPDERDAGIEAGATDYVIKGTIGGGELLNRVKELLVSAPDVPTGEYPQQADRLRVLIAEDVETIAASIAFVLSEGPFDIEIAENGALALSRLRRERYDLLLSDVEMPEMGGLELLEAVRADDALIDLPVILLTSLQNPEVQQRALNIGADRFLIKGEVGADSLRQILEDVAKARAEQPPIEVVEVDIMDTPFPSEKSSQ
ncbi:response regulator [Bradymonas sediminis]|uniref:Uncharacterized protein n=1 Tax=Bradymonas sediminis TaxID=1548548 RepID=A0A2Z4FQU8_9DELT|nr:response regulator [Bradymonas sediminis]AWV90988.1 hypothetical protein DN745_17310 [Bradymonas sediminis]TDP75271.1 Hpt domain-containing protein [Bradymonas sediminis]